jgi:ribonuclease-3
MSRSALRSSRSKLREVLQHLLHFLRRQDSFGHRQHLFPRLGFLTTAQRRLLEQILGFRPKELAYYEQALLHRSALSRLPPHAVPNERLEFLGDALLGFLTAEYLFHRYPELPEGELTKMRTWLVNRRTLAVCARHLSLEKLLFMSSSARRSLQQGNTSILANALEALIAAVYLDRGLATARRLVQERLLPIAEQNQLLQDFNYKSLLLEYAQAQGKGTPSYKVLEERGPDHAKEFVVGVYLGQECLGLGSGRSKKDAEQEAARHAWEMLQQHGLEENANGTPHL